MIPGFLDGRAVYRQFREDRSDYSADYRDFTLTDVWVREIFASDAEAVERGATILYFFPGQSRCADGQGRETVFPRPGSGDLVVLHGGTEDERTLRVAEAAYYTGAAVNPHVRLKLK